jgi:hypothetical protein
LEALETKTDSFNSLSSALSLKVLLGVEVEKLWGGLASLKSRSRSPTALEVLGLGLDLGLGLLDLGFLDLGLEVLNVVEEGATEQLQLVLSQSLVLDGAVLDVGKSQFVGVGAGRHLCRPRQTRWPLSPSTYAATILPLKENSAKFPTRRKSVVYFLAVAMNIFLIC